MVEKLSSHVNSDGRITGEELFEELFDVVPRVTIEYALCKEEKVVLVKRTSEPGIGKWHFPGGFLRAEEDLPSNARRIIEREVGIKYNLDKQIQAYNRISDDPRGHLVSILYACRARGEPKKDESRFFDIKDFPEIGFNQEEYIPKLKEYLKG